MTDIHQTVQEQLSGSVGAGESSRRAFAHGEGSSAPEDVAADGAGAAPAGARAPDGDAHAPTTTEQADDAQAAHIERDLDELLETAKQRDEYLALAQRTQADFENYRKRVAREAASAHERGVCALAKELLPALDNLDRALEAAAEDDPLLQGVRLVRTELKAALARAGIESFCPLGEQFDPAVHEAVATAAQQPGGKPGGTVVEVYQDGYRLGEVVLRPARVVVAA
jgi:molecular chaperone GrpE